MSPVPRSALPTDVRTQVSADPDLAERYRQVVINHQVADLLDARALGAGSDRADAFRRTAAGRRELGDRLLRQLLEALPDGPGRAS